MYQLVCYRNAMQDAGKEDLRPSEHIGLDWIRPYKNVVTAPLQFSLLPFEHFRVANKFFSLPSYTILLRFLRVTIAPVTQFQTATRAFEKLHVRHLDTAHGQLPIAVI